MCNQNAARKSVLPSRILAAIIAAACIISFILPLQFLIIENGTFGLKEVSLFHTLGDLLTSDVKVLGFIPTLTCNSSLGIASTLSLYYFMLSSIAAFVIAIIAIVLRDKAVCLARVATLVFTWGVAIYSLSIISVSCYLNTMPATVEKWTTVLAIGGAVIYFVLMLLKLNTKAILNGVQFLLSVAALGMFLFALSDEGGFVSDAVNASATYKKLVYAMIVLMTLLLILGTFTAMTENGIYVEFGRVIAQELVILSVLYIGYKSDLGSAAFLRYCVEGAVITLAQIVLAGVLLVRYAKAKAAPAVAEIPAAEETTAEAPATEEAENNPAENAEENEAPAEEAPASQTDEPFDPFLMTLTEEQKTEFIDLYVLKCKVPMPEIPTYEIGGDNKSFFNKVFIYLGQYRDKIPNDLLEKIHAYSIKI